MICRLLLLLLLLSLCVAVAVGEACTGSASELVQLVRRRVRSFALLSHAQRSEFEVLLQTANHSVPFLCGLDQVVADPFDDEQRASTMRLIAPFRLASDDRLWLSLLLAHYAPIERPRVAWLAVSLRYWAEELGAPLLVAVELLWRVNEAKQTALLWSAAELERYVAQSEWRDDVYQANVLAALHDAGGVSGAALCRFRDDDDVQRSLPTLTRWYDRRRLLRNLQVLMPVPPRHFEAIVRFVLLGLSGFDASALPASLAGDLAPLDVDLRADVSAQFCWRTVADPPAPGAPTRSALAAAEAQREAWEDEYDHAPEWRRAEMNRTVCSCAGDACPRCNVDTGVCVGDRCACLHTSAARFVGAQCERRDECDAPCSNDGECIGETCRCRANTFGPQCEQQCGAVYNLTVCEAFNGVPFQKPHLLFRAETRVAAALTAKCRDVAHALCADAVLVAKPCDRDPLRIAFLLVVPDASDASRAALLRLLDTLFRPAHLFAVLLAVESDALRAEIRKRVAALSHVDPRLTREETVWSRARGDAVFRASPLMFVRPTRPWTDGGFSVVQAVRDAAHQLFAHDSNAYDFLVPLDVRTQSSVAPIATWEHLLETKRGFSALDAVRADDTLLSATVYEHGGALHALPVALPLPPHSGAIFTDPRARGSFRLILHYGFMRWFALERKRAAQLDSLFEFSRDPIASYFHTALLTGRLRRRAVSFAALNLFASS
jgi:hypothetical protein